MKTTNFKTLSLMLLATLVLSLTGCDKSGTPSDAEGIIGVDRTEPVITTVSDITPPVITLNGDDNVTLNQGDTYTEENATAVDNVDGIVPVVIRGTVDTDTVGVYTLTYAATDSSANESSVTRTVNVVYSGPEPLDGNMTIDNAALQSIIGSIFDNTPYNPAISVQGVINAQGLIISVPYTVNYAPVTLAAYSTSVTLDASLTEDDESGIVATFTWAEQNLAVGSGTFTATITIDDSSGNADNVYKAKRLDIEDDIAGLIVATFPYATDSVGSTGTLSLKIMPGIPDRMFGLADNNGDVTTHMFLYLPVTNPTTGKTWLNNNLGANYANLNSPEFNITKQATASKDHNAYGSLFQWGRKADGHELITWENSTTGIGTNGSTSSPSDNPSDALFITLPVDWRVTQDDTLWAAESSVNNVCPIGYRVPTGGVDGELDLERQSWGSNNAAGALASALALPTPGLRTYDPGAGVYSEDKGYYWGSTVSGPSAEYISFRDAYSNPGGYSTYRSYGFSVRCIKN